MTRFGAPCLVLLVGVAMIATAMCPRGILRATSISKIDEPVETTSDPQLDAPSPKGSDLPGVPPLRLREEENPAFATVDLEPSPAVPGLGVEQASRAALTERPDGCEVVPASAVLPRPCGDRAPPRFI